MTWKVSLIVSPHLYNKNLENIFPLLFISLHFLNFLFYILLFLDIFHKENHVGDEFVPSQRSVKCQHQRCGSFSPLTQDSLSSLFSYSLFIKTSSTELQIVFCKNNLLFKCYEGKKRPCLHSSQQIQRNDCCVLR